MKIENQIRAFAGTFILLSLALSKLHHPNWLYFTGFVGLNLIQSSFSGFCPLEIFLRKLHTSENETCQTK